MNKPPKLPPLPVALPPPFPSQYRPAQSLQQLYVGRDARVKGVQRWSHFGPIWELDTIHIDAGKDAGDSWETLLTTQQFLNAQQTAFVVRNHRDTEGTWMETYHMPGLMKCESLSEIHDMLAAVVTDTGEPLKVTLFDPLITLMPTWI